MRTSLLLLALGSVALLGAQCDPGQPGDSCTVTGDGFTRKDSCADMCLAWEITCPGGSTITPNVCAGQVCGAGGGCPADQICLQVDSFAANSRCVPLWVCQSTTPGSGVSGPQTVDWTLIKPPASSGQEGGTTAR
jgi:hypothetical protein